MDASIYPRALPFLQEWLDCASIATATSPTALGPYALDVLAALPQGAEGDWDRNVMNPKLLRAPGVDPPLWLLFYTGNAYAGATPSAGGAPLPANQSAAQASQRVGLATARAPGGPFARRGAPVLAPRPGAWDARIVSNVAVAPFADNASDTRLLAVYKSSSPAGAGTQQTRVCFGVAAAAAFDAPFVRLSDEPILPCPDGSFDAEDPTLWRDSTTGAFHLVFKDFRGTFSHAGYSGAHAVSIDGGLTWQVTAPALAYTTTHVWSDGVRRTQHAQERAQVLLADDGTPAAMFYATDTDLDGSERYWNFAVPCQSNASFRATPDDRAAPR
jgi:hypothetical protein